MSGWDATAEAWFTARVTDEPLPEAAARLIAAILTRAAETRSA